MASILKILALLGVVLLAGCASTGTGTAQKTSFLDTQVNEIYTVRDFLVMGMPTVSGSAGVGITSANHGTLFEAEVTLERWPDWNPDEEDDPVFGRRTANNACNWPLYVKYKAVPQAYVFIDGEGEQQGIIQVPNYSEMSVYGDKVSYSLWQFAIRWSCTQLDERFADRAWQTSTRVRHRMAMAADLATCREFGWNSKVMKDWREVHATNPYEGDAFVPDSGTRLVNLNRYCR